MKILIIWGMPLIEKNAQTTCLLEKIENLNKLQNEVEYLAPKIPLTLWNSNKINNILILALYQIPFFFQILWKVINFKPDIIQSSSALVLSSVVLAKLFHIHHVVEAHGVLYEDAMMTKNSNFMIFLLKKLEKFTYKNSDKIMANAPGTKDYISEKFDIEQNRLVFIPNGANVDLFKPMVVDKLELGLSDEFTYLCFVGNLEIWQGITYIIGCAGLIHEKCPQTRFLIVGDGPLKENLINETVDRKIRDIFIFTGSVNYEDVPKFINVSEICLAPFVKWKDNKMSPLKIFEYMACGKPVITSDIKGSGDIIKNAHSGCAVNPENKQEFADSIIELLNDDELRKELGINGRNYVLNNYSWYKVAERMVNVYDDVLEI